jgi:UDP-glucuronate decarboxylase
MNSDYSDPVNLGNPDEYTIKEFANTIREMVLTPPLSPHNVDIRILPAAEDDPKKRKPDITRAKTYLGWEPKFSVKRGLQETVDWFKSQVAEGAI